MEGQKELIEMHDITERDGNEAEAAVGSRIFFVEISRDFAFKLSHELEPLDIKVST